MNLLLALLFTILPREIRAVWLTTTAGLDWPKIAAVDATTRQQQQDELCRQLDLFQSKGFNTILFQVRSRCSTDYPSTEPWETTLSGSAHRSPGYDPLAFAIEQAHRRHLQLHAWVVCFGGISSSILKQQGDASLYAQHPEWFMTSNKGVILNPGVPEVRRYLARFCQDIATRYDVDGIHLDYIRYPEKILGWNDATTYQTYAHGKPIAEWRTENITDVVRQIREGLLQVKPHVALSVAAVGKYGPVARYAAGGWTALLHAQDVVKWLNEGWIDVAYPMIYFDHNHFYPFAADWKERIYRGYLVGGLGLYYHDAAYGNRPAESLRRQLAFLKEQGYNGYALFRAAFFVNNVVDCQDLVQDYAVPFGETWWAWRHPQPILPPPLSREGLQPLPPPRVHLTRTANQLLFRVDTPNDSVSYNIYRQSPQGWQLIAQQQHASMWTYTPLLASHLCDTYWVAAYDRYGRETFAPALSAPLTPPFVER